MQSLKLEFLVVCSDAAFLKTVNAVMDPSRSRLLCIPFLERARDHIRRNRVDGIILDLPLQSMLSLVNAIRASKTNPNATIFASASPAGHDSLATAAVADFVLSKPVEEERLREMLRIAEPMMLSWRKRYLRHETDQEVQLRLPSGKLRASLANISEGGMAIRPAGDGISMPRISPGSVVHFSFCLSDDVSVSGKGEVVWKDLRGSAGIQFVFLPPRDQIALAKWLGKKMQ